MFGKEAEAMPGRIKRECKKPGCRALTASSSGYCSEHESESYLRYDRYRLSSSSRGYDEKWRRYRSWFLSLHPLCVRCGGIATVVDHIIPHKGDAALFWDGANHQALCKHCHDIKTAREDGGFGRRIKRVGGEDPCTEKF